VLYRDDFTGAVTTGAGDDSLAMTGGSAASIDSADGVDSLSLGGVVVTGAVTTGSEGDVLFMTDGSAGSVDTGSGDDVLSLSGTTVAGDVTSGAGDDRVILTDASAASLATGDGVDDVTSTNSDIAGAVTTGADGDFVTLTNGSAGSVDTGDGDDDLTVDGTAIAGDVVTGLGDDTVVMTDASAGSLSTGDGADMVTLTDTDIAGAVTTGAGDDMLAMTGGSADSIDTDGGMDSVTLVDADVTGAITTGADVDSVSLTGGSAGSVDSGDGDDVLMVDGTAIDMVTTGLGSDDVTLANFDLAGSMIDGGDDTSVADGMIDTLSLENATGTLDGTIANFEIVIATNSNLSLDGALAVGGEAGTGLFVTDGATLLSTAGFDLTGNLAVGADGALLAMGTDAVQLAVSNDMTLSGLADLRNDVAGDALTVGGDFAGGGVLGLDVDFASVTADTLSVAGDVSGVTLISLNMINTSTANGDDIVLVTADGFIEEGNFTLEGGEFMAGVYIYDIELDGEFLLLANTLVPTAPAYEALPLVLSGFAELGTMHDRFGNGIVADEEGRPRFKAGVWGQVDGEWANSAYADSEFGTEIDSDTQRYTLGGTFLPFDKLAASVSVRKSNVDAAISSILYPLEINADAVGVGGALTFMNGAGFYVDTQLRADWIDFNMESSEVARMKSDAGAETRAMSLEVGYRLPLGSSLALTPQGQLSWQDLKIDTFTGPLGGIYDDDNKNDWKTARVGLRFDAGAGTGNDGLTAFGLANVRHVFDPMMQGTVGGYQLSSYLPETTGEIGAGAQYSLGGGSLTAFAKASYEKDLSGNTDQDKASINIGLRIGF
ncbi:autotransporter outer membrane beta-barrel domain-containing protein, partial [Sphingomicrobium aestuariivivum]